MLRSPAFPSTAAAASCPQNLEVLVTKTRAKGPHAVRELPSSPSGPVVLHVVLPLLHNRRVPPLQEAVPLVIQEPLVVLTGIAAPVGVGEVWVRPRPPPRVGSNPGSALVPQETRAGSAP